MLTTPFRTIIRALNFQEDRSAELHRICPGDWPKLLELTDRSQLTLPLGVRHRTQLPEFVRERIEANLASNVARHQVLFDEYRRLSKALEDDAIEFVVLKGLAQVTPLYLDDPCHRPQYDIDLYCPTDSLEPARLALLRSGLSPLDSFSKHADHLPAMIRHKDWKWRGDYFDPELPLAVELHFQFWDTRTEKVTVECTERFWGRRTHRTIRGVDVPMLCLADSISYSALHLMRHILRGDARIYHVYEVAHFLHRTQQDNSLWLDWRGNHVAGRREAAPHVEATAFRLAAEWFGCGMHPIAEAAVKSLPVKIEQWFELFADSPLSVDRPNKDELFLHFCLADSAQSRCAILARRLLPIRAPRQVNPGTSSIAALWQRIGFIVTRLSHHARTIGPLIRSLFRWKMANRKYAA